AKTHDDTQRGPPTSRVQTVSKLVMMRAMRWRSWAIVPWVVGAVAMMGAVSCARKPEKSESAPVAPGTTVAPEGRKDQAPASESEEAPADAEDREYAPAPASEDDKTDLLERRE